VFVKIWGTSCTPYSWDEHWAIVEFNEIDVDVVVKATIVFINFNTTNTTYFHLAWPNIRGGGLFWHRQSERKCAILCMPLLPPQTAWKVLSFENVFDAKESWLGLGLFLDCSITVNYYKASERWSWCYDLQKNWDKNVRANVRKVNNSVTTKSIFFSKKYFNHENESVKFF